MKKWIVLLLLFFLLQFFHPSLNARPTGEEKTENPNADLASLSEVASASIDITRRNGEAVCSVFARDETTTKSITTV